MSNQPRKLEDLGSSLGWGIFSILADDAPTIFSIYFFLISFNIYIYFFFGENTLGECRQNILKIERRKRGTTGEKKKWPPQPSRESNPGPTRFPSNCSSSSATGPGPTPTKSWSHLLPLQPKEQKIANDPRFHAESTDVSGHPTQWNPPRCFQGTYVFRFEKIGMKITASAS